MGVPLARVSCLIAGNRYWNSWLWHRSKGFPSIQAERAGKRCSPERLRLLGSSPEGLRSGWDLAAGCWLGSGCWLGVNWLLAGVSWLLAGVNWLLAGVWLLVGSTGCWWGQLAGVWLLAGKAAGGGTGCWLVGTAAGWPGGRVLVWAGDRSLAGGFGRGSWLTVVARCGAYGADRAGACPHGRAGRVPPGQPIANRAGSGWDRAVSNGLACRLAGWGFLNHGRATVRLRAGARGRGWRSSMAHRSPEGNERTGGGSQPSVRTAYTWLPRAYGDPKGWRTSMALWSPEGNEDGRQQPAIREDGLHQLPRAYGDPKEFPYDWQRPAVTRYLNPSLPSAGNHPPFMRWGDGPYGAACSRAPSGPVLGLTRRAHTGGEYTFVWALPGSCVRKVRDDISSTW